jgi:hypothetical protein
MEIKELWQVARELVGEEELTRRFRGWISTLIRTARIKRQNSDIGAYTTRRGNVTGRSE